MHHQAHTKVSGICPVIETPFTDAGEIDLESFDNLIDHLIMVGIRSVMFPGFASEYYKLSDNERELLTARLINRFRDVPDGQVVISIPDHATPLAVRRARGAVGAGAHMINVLPPHLLGPSSSAVRDHVTALLDAIEPTPAIIQFAPAQTGTNLDATVLSQMAAGRPNLVQVKVESTPPGQLISALRTADRPLGSLVGYAGVQMIDALRRGAEGVQPGCSFAEIHLKIWQLWHADDEQAAIALHTRLLPYISYWMQHVELIISAEKRISKLRGLIASDHCRAPSRTLDHQEQLMIDRFLAEFADLLPTSR